MDRSAPTPWAGRCVRAETNRRDIWRFAADGRSVVLDTGEHQAALVLRETKTGWLATSRPLTFLFRRDGMWMQFRLGGTHVETFRMLDLPTACS